MVTIRNPQACHSRTVVAATALEMGQFVKLVQGTAKGEPCQVQAVVEADLADVTAVIGMVMGWIDNDEAVDYIIDPTNEALTRNTGDDNTYKIAAGSLCTFWRGELVVGFHQEDVAAGFTISAAREGQAVAIDVATAKLHDYDGAVPARDKVVGIILQHEGPEITVLLSAL